MNTTEIVLGILSIIILLPTFASITKFDQWWIRGFDFPRIQITMLIIIIFVLDAALLNFKEIWHLVITSLLGLSFVYQALKIYPYTYLSPKEVLRFKGTDPKNLISILVS
ncbi:MAG: endonuclease, partial [Gillisia sp.]